MFLRPIIKKFRLRRYREMAGNTLKLIPRVILSGAYDQFFKKFRLRQYRKVAGNNLKLILRAIILGAFKTNFSKKIVSGSTWIGLDRGPIGSSRGPRGPCYATVYTETRPRTGL